MVSTWGTDEGKSRRDQVIWAEMEKISSTVQKVKKSLLWRAIRFPPKPQRGSHLPCQSWGPLWACSWVRQRSLYGRQQHCCSPTRKLSQVDQTCPTWRKKFCELNEIRNFLLSELCYLVKKQRANKKWSQFVFKRCYFSDGIPNAIYHHK